MWILLALACSAQPVPAHPQTVETLRAAALQLDFATTSRIGEHLAAPVEGLSAADRRAWGRIQEVGSALAAAKKKSTFSKAYGDLLQACRGCHLDQPVPPLEGSGHALAFARLDQSVVYGDAAVAVEARERVFGAPDLGPSHGRLVQLAGTQAEGPSGRWAGKTMLVCYQCHGVGLDRSVGSNHASVKAVETEGDPGAYRFAVTLESPDVDCRFYANWWEVVGEDGTLLYRRILGHSHAGEQPFTRLGGPVPIQPDTPVWVRGHFHPEGYGGDAFFGTPAGGFEKKTPPADWAALAETEPLPKACAF